MPWSYIGLQDLRKGLNITNVEPGPRDDWLLTVAEAVTRYIDKWCGRTFRVYHGAQIVTPEWHDWISVPDFTALTTLKTDLDEDAIFETTWDTGDYYLTPLNAPLSEKPYTRIHIRATGDWSFPRRAGSVEITATWGYWEDRELLSATLGANITTAATSFAVSNAELIQVGWTLRCGTEQMFVTARNTTAQTITVERAVNGSTVATHTAGDAFEVYRYPAPIVAATMLHCARIYKRSETPLGIVNVPGDIGWRAVYIPAFDVDVRTMLQIYRKRSIL